MASDALKINKIKNISFDNSIQNKLKYFTPPRFLIVEVNSFARINLIDILRIQRIKHLVDIATSGCESIQKFKLILNKG